MVYVFKKTFGIPLINIECASEKIDTNYKEIFESRVSHMQIDNLPWFSCGWK